MPNSSKNIDKNKFLKELIQQRGSIKDFAMNIQMPYTTLLSILKNVDGASFDNILKICHGLNITPEDLKNCRVPTDEAASMESPNDDKATAFLYHSQDPETIYDQIGYRIRTLRKLQKITMKEVGQRIGISESMVHRYETGDIRSFSIEMLENIARVLNVNPCLLLGWNTDSVPMESYCILQCTASEKDLIQKYHQLPLESQKTIDAILDLQYNLACKIKSTSPSDDSD